MPARVPFAEYELTAMPEGTHASMRVGDRLVLSPADRVEMGVTPDATIQVKRHAGLHFGGRKNHGLMLVDGRWELSDYGHGLPIHVNGQVMGQRHLLHDGDRVVPSVALGEGEALVFTFFQRDDLDPLFDELSGSLRELLDAGPVLLDWLMEKGLSLDDAHRATAHFRFRCAFSGWE